MKYRILVLALLMLCGLGVVQAQDDELEYRLHVPTVAEYLKVLPSVINSYPSDDSGELPYDFIDALENIFEVQYGSTASAAELSNAYDLLDYGSSRWSDYMPYLDARSWNKSIVERWFEENATQLNNLPEIKFLTYTINSTPYDFDGDGKKEWLLHIKREGSFGDYWVAWLDHLQKSGYRFDYLPIPFQKDGFWPAQEEWSGANLDRVEDVNADGKPELIFESSAAVPASWVIAGEFRFYLVGWHKTGFEILTTNIHKNQKGELRLQHVYPSIRTQEGKYWTFHNVDKDGALEMLENVRYEDNYECVDRTFVRYDWDGFAYYRQTQTDHTQEPSVNCALRDAEKEMWAYHYSDAVPLYEEAIARYDNLPASGKEHIPHIQQFAAYAKERLILAYALAGDMNQATTLLNQMRREPSDSKVMLSALIKVSKDGTTAFELCKAAYDFFDYYPKQYTLEFYQYRDLPDLGFSDTDYHGFTTKGGPPRPVTVGCDIGQFASDIIAAHSFSTSQSPVEQILQLGIEVDKQLHADLNGDHIDDWIIWVKGGNRSFGFVSDGDSYKKLDQSYFPYPSENSNIFSLLPDGKGSIWLQLHPASTRADICDQSGGSYIQTLDIWALMNDQIVQQQSIPVCEQPTIQELFPNDQKLHAWRNIEGDYAFAANAIYSSAVYIWDSEKRLYVLENPPVVPTSQVNETQMEGIEQSQAPVYFMWELKRALWYEKNFPQSLEIANAILARGNADDPDELHYYRGLTLEALNRPDEALAEYVVIYKNAPESAWGKLAALHLECVANCEHS